MFEGKLIWPADLVLKIEEEAGFWLLAQTMEKQEERDIRDAEGSIAKVWSPPPKGWDKCNVGVAWNSKSKRSGGSWVLRNEKGKVLIHSRRTFSNIQSLEEAKFQGLLWSLECMNSHRRNRVIVAIDDTVLPNIILRPKAWPNFRWQYAQMMGRLRKIEWWRLIKESKATNRGAFLIAQSVIKGDYAQSYVATGPPLWLKETFENEEISPSS
ncbi:hypothetical protein Bca52824_015479 [Brassica carinata]|uniref:RNase H type-1 domain-containing protein n=1 Tax=Brassica carinata TaxID=52824 RepID=A0A8X7W263_BRACI|nr:hypothetical protein Bca52824_015479 [Brassica carinata]